MLIHAHPKGKPPSHHLLVYGKLFHCAQGLKVWDFKSLVYKVRDVCMKDNLYDNIVLGLSQPLFMFLSPSSKIHPNIMVWD